MVLAAARGNVHAAAGDGFYENLYRRGLARYAEGNFAAAAGDFRIAAFGDVESVDRFETAYAYIAAASLKVGRTDDARAAVRRIMAAEKVDRHYASLPLPADVREAVENAARTLLPREEYALWRSGVPSGSANAAVTTTAATQPAPRAAVTTPAPVVATSPADTPRVAPPSAPIRNEPPPLAASAPSSAAAKSNRAPQPTVAVRDTPPAAQPTSQPQPRVETPQPQTQPRIATPQPEPLAETSQPKSGAAKRNASIESLINDGDRAVAAGDLEAARYAYRAALLLPALPHGAALAIGTGLYRARDFRGALDAFARAGVLSGDEQHYRYYRAVALYETGSYGEAKRELAAALPFLDVTPDVARYQMKIEGAVE